MRLLRGREIAAGSRRAAAPAPRHRARTIIAMAAGRTRADGLHLGGVGRRCCDLRPGVRSAVRRPTCPASTDAGSRGARPPGTRHEIRPESVSRRRRFRSARISAARLIPQVAILLQRLEDDPLELRRQVRPQLRAGAWRLVQNRDEGQRRRVRRGKAIAPVAISYSTTPNENRSVRTSSSSPRACSGDM